MKTAQSSNVSTGMQHIQHRGFNWHKATERALQHQYVRAIHLARTNTDYQIKYPSECRDNPDKKILLHCHLEAKKRIDHDHENILSNAMVPVVERPQRVNRNG